MWTSKLGNRFPREEVERHDAEHHRILERLRRDPRNASCAECGEGGTCWASVNLGVFVCLRCADVHRALGTHVSKVKGCTGTYLWGPDEVAQMQGLGNAAAQAKYVGSDCSAARPGPTASKEERVELCRKKYEQLVWAPRHPPSEAFPSAAQALPSSAQASQSAVHGVGQSASRARARKGTGASSSAACAASTAPGDINWDAMFADFDSAAARASVSTLCANMQQQEAAPPAPSPCSLAHSSPASLDDFLGQCLARPEPPIAAGAPYMPAAIPAVGPLARSGSDSVWSSFGTW